MNIIVRSLPCFCIVFLVLSCASPRVAYKENFDFSKIKTIRVGMFTPVGNEQNSGNVIAGEFIRQLLAQGYSVKTSPEENADVVLVGNVVEYLPNRRYLITSQDNEANTGSQTVIVNKEAVELSGSNAYSFGSAFGLDTNNRIVVSNATVGISAYVKDSKTGEVIWSNSYTYEGLDLSTALENTVAYLLRSLKK